MVKEKKEKLYGRIEELREKLNNHGKDNNYCSESVLDTSQKLDELILEYYKEEKSKI